MATNRAATLASRWQSHYCFPEDAKLWRARAREAGLSRVWGAIQWPADNVPGARMGRRIGGLVVERDGAEE